MKKIFSLFAALTLCVGLWAEAPANVEYVDLGLPSGLKWATFNVGATAPEGYGDYFAWGETAPHQDNDYSSSKYTLGNDIYGDDKILKPEYDAATANWGSDWRMPTLDEFNELANEENCTWEWKEDYNGTGIKGYLVTSKKAGYTDKSIFLPVAGYCVAKLFQAGEYGSYWTSSLADVETKAYSFDITSGNKGSIKNIRSDGYSVRPVTTKSTPATVKAAYIDENGASQEVDAIEITDASATLAAGWYVVNGTDVQISTLTCQGEVHLILADGAKLTATGDKTNWTPGIQVSGEGISLTIYAQSTGDQMGQLIAKGVYGTAGIGGGNTTDNNNSNGITINGGVVTATGGDDGAGIGGGGMGKGSNITINGGIVTATGGRQAAGIGGGSYGSGSNITINGGTITASGGKGVEDYEVPAGDAIGSGSQSKTGAFINIIVATKCILKADGNNPPTTVIANNGSDLASSLAGQRYATVETPTAALPKVNDDMKENKFLHNGQLIIHKNNKTYNAQGQIIQ